MTELMQTLGDLVTIAMRLVVQVLELGSTGGCCSFGSPGGYAR